MTRTALIIVDVQGDFIDGSLGGEGRRDVIPPLISLAERADLVVASRDWHPADHFSFAEQPEFRDGSWPAHCVQGTDGAQIPALVEAVADTIVNKGTDPATEAYSAFDGQDEYGRSLLAELSHHGIERVIVGGLCTDYCVKATALDAAKHGFQTVVPLDACAAVDDRTKFAAIREMVDAGVRVTKSAYLLAEYHDAAH